MSAPRSKKSATPSDELEVCKRLAFARKSAGFNQDSFAEKLGISRDRLANIETGRSTLRFDTGWKACEILDANPLWIATGQSAPRPFVPVRMEDYQESFSMTDSFQSVCIGPLRDPLQKRADVILATRDIHKARNYISASYVDALEGLLKAMIVKVPEELRDQFFDELYIAAKDFISRISEGEGGYYEVTPSNLTLQIDAKRLHQFEMQKSERLSILLSRVEAATAQRGKRAELARFLNVPPQRVREWLALERAPGGETTLRLLEWVTVEEAQRKAPAGASNTREGRRPAKPITTNEKKADRPRKP